MRYELKGLLHRSRLETFQPAGLVGRHWSVVAFRRLTLMIFLEAWHDTQIRLTFRTVIFSFAPEDPSVRVNRVPAEVAAESWPRPERGAMARAGRCLEREITSG